MAQATFDKDELNNQQAKPFLARITIAHGVLLIIGLAAAVLRLSGLGMLPLNSAEAQSALAAYLYWQPADAVVSTVSPAYLSLTALLMPILGNGDALARFVPALFGVGLVLLPWLLQRQIGVAGALAAAALLAVSPVLSIMSRTAGGDSIALFAAVLLAFAWLRRMFADLDEAATWYLVAAGALGLGLASSSLFYSFLLVLIVALFAQRILGLPLADAPIKLDRVTRRNGLLVALVIFVGSSTMLLWNPAGLGYAVTLFTDWLAGFSFSAESIFALTRYHAGLVVLGLIAAVYVLYKGDRLGVFCTLWIIAGTILVLLQGGQLSTLAILVVPLTLVIGLLFGRWFAQEASWEKWLVAVGIFIFGMLLLVNAGRFLRAGNFENGDISFLFIVAFGVLLMAALMLLIINFSNDGYVLVQGILLGVLGLMLYTGWGTAWWLTHDAANDVRERWVTTATANDMQRFDRVLDTVSAEKTGAATDLKLISTVDSPVLRWTMRDMPNASFGAGIPPAAQFDAVLTPADAAQPFAGDYLSMPFVLRNTRVEPLNIAEMNVADVLRWWFFHDGSVATEQEAITLWVRE
jgi:hypothetical protein